MKPGGPSPAGWGLGVALCCAALLALGPVYDTNDDPAIIGLLSGAFGGRALDAVYLGSTLSRALRTLYAVAPGVPWYGLVIEACNVVSAGLWAALIASCGLRPALRLAATAGLLIGYSYLLLRVNFMAAAFSLLFAAAAWLWKLQLERDAPRWRQAWLGVAIGAAHLLRPSLQWMMLFFALPLLLVSSGRHNLKRLLLVGIPAGALILTTAAGDRGRLADPAAQALASLNRARSFLVDIPREPLPQALAAAGWSLGDYEVAVRFGVYDQELYGVERIRAFLAHAGSGAWADRYLRTSGTYLLGRFHLLCLAALLGVLWLRWVDGGRPGAALTPPVTRALVWAWVGAGLLALAVTRFPPRAFVPLYLYAAALAFLVPPLTRAAAARPARRAPRVAALAGVASLLCFVLVFWLADARSGRARLAADSRELASGIGSLGEDAIPVPVGLLLEVQYSAVLAPPRAAAPLRMPPTGWVVATPALGEFLSDSGFASGRDFMRGLVSDRRVVFVVRRTRRPDAEWLVGRLNERYAPGERLAIEPLESPEDAAQYLFFRLRSEPARPLPGVVESRGRT